MRKIFVNGTFDVLHQGHLSLLHFAKQQGDYLLVALDSDSRVKTLKGADRPFNDLETRLAIISALRWVDETTSFSTSTELELKIQNYSPDIMLVGSDWKGKTVIGSQYAKQVMFFDRIQKFSTTNSLQNYISSIRENC
jgi:rfaE bifunctional protein nucleotidyltransferase chain/domain